MQTSPNRTRLFISNLDRDITRQLVHDHFSEYGKITDLCLSDGFGRFGFVEFQTAEEAVRAIRWADGRKILDNRIGFWFIYFLFTFIYGCPFLADFFNIVVKFARDTLTVPRRDRDRSAFTLSTILFLFLLIL